MMDVDFKIDLYEHRDAFNHSCSIMIALCIVAVLFTSEVWWVSIFTCLVASMGYYSSLLPLTPRKISLTHFFFYTSYILLFIQMIGDLMLFVFVTDTMGTHEKNGWEVSCLLLGTFAIFALAWATYTASLSCSKYRSELLTHPPAFFEERSEKFIARSSSSSDYYHLTMDPPPMQPPTRAL